MATLDTLTIRFEADAENLFAGLTALETRLNSLKGDGEIFSNGELNLSARLSAVSDEAITGALSRAGETLAQAVRAQDIRAADAVSGARAQLSAALEAAVDKIASSIHITVPVSVDGYRLGLAAVRGIRRVAAAQGTASAL